MSPRPPILSRAQAACVLFDKPFTSENGSACIAKLDEIGNGLVICHSGNPERPVLITNSQLHKHPTLYIEYPLRVPTEVERLPATVPPFSWTSAEVPEDLDFFGDRDLFDFINIAFKATEPNVNDKDAYKLECIGIEEIYRRLSTRIRRFEHVAKPGEAFKVWAKQIHPDFLDLQIVRKRARHEDGGVSRTRSRNIYVLKDAYWAREIQNTAKQTKAYLAMVETLKTEDAGILGYVRDIPVDPHELPEKRARRLKMRMDLLLRRSKTERVYLSPCTYSDDPISDRDKDMDEGNKTLLSHLSQCAGHTQDMLQHLRENRHKDFAIVSFDYQGITTNSEDLHKFLAAYQNVKCIIIDNSTRNHKLDILSRKDLIENSYVLEKFTQPRAAEAET